MQSFLENRIFITSELIADVPGSVSLIIVYLNNTAIIITTVLSRSRDTISEDSILLSEFY